MLMACWIRKLRALVLFALKCSRTPQSLTKEDYDRLREHGLKKSEIVEIIAMSAFAVYANIIADATAMDPDELFGTTKSGKSRPRADRQNRRGIKQSTAAF